MRKLLRPLALAVLLALPVLPGAAMPTPLGYVGTFTKSSTDRKGTRVTIANLTSPTPYVTWPSGAGNPTTKAFEDEEKIVLIMVATMTGSTETFYLNKKTKRFTVVEVSLFSGQVGAVEPAVSHGTLQ